MRVNGSQVSIDHDTAASLLDVLRRDLGLTGAKEACGVGECGACTVLVDDRPTFSCTTLAARVKGHVETIEGLGSESADLRAALVEAGGIQCGFCTPGMVVAAVAARRAGISPEPAVVRRHMSGNICRCTGYASIIAAVIDFVTEPHRTSDETGVAVGVSTPSGPERPEVAS